VRGAWLGAMLWALHPVQVELVAWISQLKNNQSGVFCLLSVWFFLRWIEVETGTGAARGAERFTPGIRGVDPRPRRHNGLRPETMKPSSPPASAPGAGRWRVALAAIGIAAAALAVYYHSFSGVFVFDDEPAILQNPTIRHLWPLWRSLCPPPDATVSGRPVANFSLAVNYALSGTHVWSYHAVNLLIHILAGLTLFGIVRRTISEYRRPETGDGTRERGDQRSEVKGQKSDARGQLAAPKRLGASGSSEVGIQNAEPRTQNPKPKTQESNSRPGEPTLLAFGVALLWTLHPLQTEAVTYVVQRVESLMALFYLLTFYCFIRSLGPPHVRRWRCLAIAACLLGVGTKEVMATAPVLLLLYDRTFVAGSFRRAWAERRGFHLTLAATWLPLAALVASTGWNRGGTAGFDVGVSPWAYWLTQFEAVARYLWLSVWPHPLIFDYKTFWIRHPAEVAPYAVVVLALAAATLWALRRRPAAGFLGAWFFVILAPTSVVPGTMEMIVEHRMYLPLAAVAVAAVCSAQRWFGRRSMVVFLALATGLGWIAAQRNAVYRSERSLWSDTIAKYPDSDRANNNLGNALLKAGDVREAIAHYQAAVRLRPNYAEAHYNLGNGLQRTGRTREAIAHYEQALQANPNMPDAQTALGIALEEAGRGDEAVAHYEQALRLDPNYADAHNDLGLALSKAGRLPEAIAQYEQALQINPALPDVHNNLGNALRAVGKAQEAIAHYEQALRLKPDYAAAHNNLGNALREADRLPEAIAQFEQALQLNPAVPEVHNNLGTVLLMVGRTPEAIAQFEWALRLNPNLVQVHMNLAIALESAGRSGEAAAQYEAARRLGAAVPPSSN
jgi:tetratricopeptide (TPR) repeat protein